MNSILTIEEQKNAAGDIVNVIIMHNETDDGHDDRMVLDGEYPSRLSAVIVARGIVAGVKNCTLELDPQL